MNHADIQIIRIQQLHHLLKPGFDFRQITGPQILPVFPDGTEMGLDQEFLPAAFQRFPDSLAYRRIRCI